MSDKPVRVRFAPSPTGSLHIGGARTALFNWLFARHHGGQFILRIEDTDQKRSVAGAIDELMDGLRWLGITWDEGPDVGGEAGPYVQSERRALYQKWADWLVAQGKAYRDYATPDELARAREIAEKNPTGKRAGYERLHRFISDDERAQLAAERESYVIRLAMPLQGETVVEEALRGTIRFPNAELSDIVLLKADGFPTYHLAMAVDDHFMGITHVMRSDEWTSSLPMHQVLYEAFGWEPPTFVHLPIMTYNNKKMSKRNPPMDDQGQPIPIFVREYHELGFLPEAVTNWLATIGWSFGDDVEFFSTAQAVERFTLARVNPAPTEMPYGKLIHLNGQYIRAMAPDDFIAAITPHLREAYGEIDAQTLQHIAPHVQERVNPLPTVVEWLGFLFGDFTPPADDDLIQKKMDAASTREVLHAAHAALAELPDYTVEAIEVRLRALTDELQRKTREVFNTIRWATTNQRASPPLFDSLYALGRDETLRRLALCAERLSAN